MKIIEKQIQDLKPYDKNPRNNDDAVQYVANSIKQFGWKVPVVIDKDGVIVAGHTRYKAALELNIHEIPCIVADDLTPEQIKAFRLADNKVGEIAGWDFTMLDSELDGLKNCDIDMKDFGFDLNIDSSTDSDNQVEEDDFSEDTKINEHKVEKGQIWQLGNHRLMCGDSTSADDVAMLMDGAKADMVFTDPPYNVNYQEKEKRLLKYRPNERVEKNINTNIENDNKGQEYKDFCHKIALILKNNSVGSIYVCGGVGKDGRILFVELDNILHNSTTIIWNKNHFVLGDGKYQNNYEPIWYG